MVSLLKKNFIVHRKKVLPDEIQLRFLKRFSRLLANGYSMIDALEAMKLDKQLIMITKQIIISLKHGTSIDQAFDQAHFHSSITSYFYFIKENGDVLSSIEKCVTMYENRLAYKRKFQEMIRYPLILLIIFSVLLYFVKQFVLPSFIQLFQSNALASSTITFSMVMIEYLTLLAIGISMLTFILIIIWQINKRKINIETQIKWFNYIPVYRKYLSLQTSFQLATHLSTQLKTGMSLKDILHNMSRQSKMPIIAYYASLMIVELNNGLQLTNLLSKLSLLEKELTEIFQKNINQEALEKDLDIYAEILTEELHRKMMKTITLIQPIFFILVACFIVSIYLTLMWPMFQLIKSI